MMHATVSLSFGSAVFRCFGRNVQQAYLGDLMRFYSLTAEFLEAETAPEGLDLYGPLERLARACAITPLPDDLTTADLHTVALTLWELNDVEDLLGKTLPPLRFLMDRQLGALRSAQAELQALEAQLD